MLLLSYWGWLVNTNAHVVSAWEGARVEMLFSFDSSWSVSSAPSSPQLARGVTVGGESGVLQRVLQLVKSPLKGTFKSCSPRESFTVSSRYCGRKDASLKALDAHLRCEETIGGCCLRRLCPVAVPSPSAAAACPFMGLSAVRPRKDAETAC